MQGFSSHRSLHVCNKMRRNLQARLIFVILLMCGTHSNASQQVEFDYYDIQASTGRELQAQIASKGPSGYSGYTHWNISYQFSTSLRSGDCRLVSTNLNLSTKYQMPRWENESEADWELKDRWKTWYASLLEHEEEHGSHGIAAYDSITSHFKQISSEPTCAELGSRLADIVSQVTAEYLTISKEFDELTQHGVTQGAALENLLDERDRAPLIGAAMAVDENGPLKMWLKMLSGLLMLYLVKRKIFS